MAALRAFNLIQSRLHGKTRLCTYQGKPPEERLVSVHFRKLAPEVELNVPDDVEHTY